jgi:T5SS/PEP-CTERM-associated repeat protein
MSPKASIFLRKLLIIGGRVLIVLGGLPSIAVPAVVSNWNSDSNGNFESPSSWDNGVPGANDSAVFQRGNVSYDVQFNSDIETQSLLVGTNTVSFKPNGTAGTYTVNDSSTQDVVVGSSAGDIAELTSYLPNFTFSGATIGDAFGSTGTLNIASGTTHSILPSGYSRIDVGASGNGNLNVVGGATLDSHGYIFLGTNSGSVGTMHVDNSIVSFNSDTSIVAGSSGTGNLYVQNGGQITKFSEFGAGGESGSVGYINIDGQTSLVDARGSGTLFIGGLGNGALSITNGGQAIKFFRADIGLSAGSSGSVSVDGTGSKLSVTTATLRVGGLGSASITITNGGEIDSASSTVGGSLTGSVVVDGNSSAWKNSSTLALDPTGTVSVKNKGLLTSNGTTLGNPIGPSTRSGVISVDGADTTWTNSGSLTITNALPVGSTAAANLAITNGGKVTNTTASIGSFGRSSILVDGAGSSWTSSGAVSMSGVLTVTNNAQVTASGLLTVGSNGKIQGNGTIVGNIKDGGTVAPGMSPGILSVTGNYTQDSAGILQIELGGLTAGNSYDRLSVTGSDSLAGSLQVSLINNFTPSMGDSFDILDALSISGSFTTLQLPSLPGSLQWNTSQLYTSGVIFVVPEPTTITLMVLSLPLLSIFWFGIVPLPLQPKLIP